MTSRSWMPVTAVLSACLFMAGVSAASIAPYRAIIAIDGLGFSNTGYALIITLSSIGMALASVVLGYASDKIADRKVLVIVCALLGAVAYGLIYFVPTQVSYIVAFCVLLPFGGALFSQSFSFSRAYYDRHQPTRSEFMMSAMRSLFSLAWVVTPPIAGWVATTYSMFGVLAIAGFAQVGFTLLFGLLFAAPQTRIGTTAKQRGEASAARVRIPGFRLVGIGGVALMRIALLIHLAALPLVLTKDLGGSLTDVGINASLAAALEVPFMLAWGYAATRMAKEPILIGNALLFAAYLVLVFFARSVQEVLLLQVLNAIATAALLSLTISYMQETIKGRVGLSTSLIDVVTVVAGFASAGLFALLSSPTSYANLMAAGGAICAVGAALLILSILMRPKADMPAPVSA